VGARYFLYFQRLFQIPSADAGNVARKYNNEITNIISRPPKHTVYSHLAEGQNAY